jgi:hypothetical protein
MMPFSPVANSLGRALRSEKVGPWHRDRLAVV